MTRTKLRSTLALKVSPKYQQALDGNWYDVHQFQVGEYTLTVPHTTRLQAR
ncbi:hypothetical protein KBD87_03770 [Candidatus Saccharibacteria bacterium]|nr:hypothetical protein [Candidatus Saccharibacteria bacterium]